jgi:hypothetical protein
MTKPSLMTTPRIAMFGIALGVTLLVYGVAHAVPNWPCVQTCKDFNYWIYATTNPYTYQQCQASSLPDCTRCYIGQCVPLNGISNPAACTLGEQLDGSGKTIQIQLNIYDISACNTPCSTVLINGWTEATAPVGNIDSSININNYLCPVNNGNGGI